MKVLLIDPPWYSLQGISTAPVPLGLGYLASYLKENGHKCLIFSGEVGITKKIKHQKVVIENEDDETDSLKKNPAWEKVLRKLAFLLKDYNPDLIGISMPTAKYGIAKELIKFIKYKNKNIKIVLGGPHPTILPEETLKINGVDFVIHGEGEETLLELVEAIERNKSLSKIKGLWYKKNNKIIANQFRPYIQNLDDLPFPDWDLLYEHHKMPPSFFGQIIGSRGCPYQCIFCASKRIWGLGVRYRSINNIISEIKEKKEKYHVNSFNFNDDSFTLRKDKIFEFCDRLIIEKINIEWKCDTRVNLVDYELLKKMKDAGCIQINMGIECGNEKMLKYIKKGITIPQVIKAFEIANRLGIQTMAYFMIGFPEETRKDIEDSISLMKKIKPSHPCWSIATPYPGTELYEICTKEGLIKDTNWEKFHHHSKKMGFSKNIPKNELVKIAEDIEKITFKMKLRYYLTHPKRLLKGLRII